MGWGMGAPGGGPCCCSAAVLCCSLQAARLPVEQKSASKNDTGGTESQTSQTHQSLHNQGPGQGQATQARQANGCRNLPAPAPPPSQVCGWNPRAAQDWLHSLGARRGRAGFLSVDSGGGSSCYFRHVSPSRSDQRALGSRRAASLFGRHPGLGDSHSHKTAPTDWVAVRE